MPASDAIADAETRRHKMSTTYLSYTDLTPDQRASWDAMVSDCPACKARDDDEPCSDHDLSEMSTATLAAMIAAEERRRGGVSAPRCLCGAARVGAWTGAGVHHGARRCARVVTPRAGR
jgi:hypothetical protein